MIKGLYETHLNETHLNVTNLEQAINFYSETLGLEQCHYDAKRKIAFYWIGQPRQAMLGLWEYTGDHFQPRHFAFECNPDWVLNESVNFFKSKNLKFWNFLNDGIERPMVFAWMPALSIYFNDPSGNELEFIGILDGRSRPELGILSFEDWRNLEKK